MIARKNNNSIYDLRNALIYFKKMHYDSVILIWVIKIVFFYITARIGNFLISDKKSDKKIKIAFDSIHFTGNPRAVYEKINEKYSDKYECYWIAKRKETIKQIKKRKGKVVYSYSVFGLSKFLKTKIWIRSHPGMGVFSFLPTNEYKLIQLWHGIGPKGINHPPEEYNMHDIWCVSSKYAKKRHIELWDAPKEKLFVTGFAEMDLLYKYIKMKKEKLLDELAIEKRKKIILYAPTYDIGLWPWDDQYKEFEELCKYCQEKNLQLILRLHPYAKVNRNKIKKIVNSFNNIYWLDMVNEPDTMKLLAVSDILLTDWSSIYTDFLLTKRPIIHLETNTIFFTKERGKPEVPPSFRAGEITSNKKEFYQTLNLVLEKGNRYKKEQEKLLNIIHGRVDGNSSERIIKIIEGVL